MSDKTGGPAFPNGPGGDSWHHEDGRVSHQLDAHPGMALLEKVRRRSTGNDFSQVQDHSPDAGKMARLEEENGELRRALHRLLECHGHDAWEDAARLASATLAKHQTHKKEAGHE